MAKSMSLASLDNLSNDKKDFFNAAIKGNKKVLKRLIDSGNIYDVDIKNDKGQTPLFCASISAEEECVKYLLEHGANPNEPTDHGQTPLHAACYSGCIKAVSSLVEKGGDFRFHDKEQRTAKDWAMLNPNTKKRQLMTEYIVKTRMFAMTHSGRDILLERQSSMFMRKPSENVGSMAQLFKRISSKGKAGNDTSLKASASLMSLGYGKVYGGEKGGIISTIPMVAESMLKHDDYGTTFSNNAFYVMEGMMFGPTKVSVKRLHHDPPKGGVVDHLIKECENIAHLRHPNVLLLMATCATDNMEGLVLIFERIYFGSLFNYLHEKNQQPAMHATVEAGVQMCDGLIYIHQNNLIHNYISSHSVFLTNCNTLKIGNFEYMVPMTIGGKAAKLPGVSTNRYLNAAYNWMPPEIMKGEMSTEKSDIYGFCAVMWEMFTGFIPWAGHDSEQIERQVCNQKMLKVNDSHVPAKFVDVLTYGLQPNPNNRKMNLEQIRDILSLLPRGQGKADKTGSPAAQTNNHCSADVSDSTSLWHQPSSFRRKRSKRKRKGAGTDPLTVQSPISNSYTRGESPKPLRPSRKKHLSAISSGDTTVASSCPSASQAFTAHRSILKKSGKKKKSKTPNKIQECLAVKAPLHVELMAVFAKSKGEDMKAAPLTPDSRDEEDLCPKQLKLNRILNKELNGIFRQTGYRDPRETIPFSSLSVHAPAGEVPHSVDDNNNITRKDAPLPIVKQRSCMSQSSSNPTEGSDAIKPASHTISGLRPSCRPSSSVPDLISGSRSYTSQCQSTPRDRHRGERSTQDAECERGEPGSSRMYLNYALPPSKIIKAAGVPSGYLEEIDRSPADVFSLSHLEPYQMVNPESRSRESDSTDTERSRELVALNMETDDSSDADSVESLDFPQHGHRHEPLPPTRALAENDTDTCTGTFRDQREPATSSSHNNTEETASDPSFRSSDILRKIRQFELQSGQESNSASWSTPSIRQCSGTSAKAQKVVFKPPAVPQKATPQCHVSQKSTTVKEPVIKQRAIPTSQPDIVNHSVNSSAGPCDQPVVTPAEQVKVRDLVCLLEKETEVPNSEPWQHTTSSTYKAVTPIVHAPLTAATPTNSHHMSVAPPRNTLELSALRATLLPFPSSANGDAAVNCVEPAQEKEKTHADDIRNMISNFQHLATEHEKKQQEWNKYSTGDGNVEVADGCRNVPGETSQGSALPCDMQPCSRVPPCVLPSLSPVVKPPCAGGAGEYTTEFSPLSVPGGAPPVVNRTDIYMKDKFKKVHNWPKPPPSVYMSQSKSCESSEEMAELLRGVASSSINISLPPLFDVPELTESASTSSWGESDIAADVCANLDENSFTNAPQTVKHIDSLPADGEYADSSPADVGRAVASQADNGVATSQANRGSHTVLTDQLVESQETRDEHIATTQYYEENNGQSNMNECDNESLPNITDISERTSSLSLRYCTADEISPRDELPNRYFTPLSSPQMVDNMTITSLEGSLSSVGLSSGSCVDGSGDDTCCAEQGSTWQTNCVDINNNEVEDSEGYTESVKEMCGMPSTPDCNNNGACEDLYQHFSSEEISAENVLCEPKECCNAEQRVVKNEPKDFLLTHPQQHQTYSSCMPDVTDSKPATGMTCHDATPNETLAQDLPSLCKLPQHVPDMSFQDTFLDTAHHSVSSQSAPHHSVPSQSAPHHSVPSQSAPHHSALSTGMSEESMAAKEIPSLPTFKYNLSLYSSEGQQERKQRIEILCENRPLSPKIITNVNDDTVQTIVSKVDEDSADITIKENGQPTYSVKLSQAHKMTDVEDGPGLITTKHAVETHIFSPFCSVLQEEGEHVEAQDSGIQRVITPCVNSKSEGCLRTTKTGSELIHSPSGTSLNVSVAFQGCKRAPSKVVRNELAEALNTAEYTDGVPHCTAEETSQGRRSEDEVSIFSNLCSEVTEYADLPAELSSPFSAHIAASQLDIHPS